MPKKKILLHALFIIVPLLMGAGIYAFARAIKPVLFEWAGITNHTLLLSLPYWVRYNLPDGLWLYALLNCLLLIWYSNTLVLYRLTACVFATSAIAEVSQLSHSVPGTFDVLDLLAYALATAAFFLVNKPYTYTYEKHRT